jgi:hypothetical protein
MYSLELLLCNYREISEYTRAVSRQHLDEHVLASTDTYATIELLLETVFSNRSVKCVITKAAEATKVSVEYTCNSSFRSLQCYLLYSVCLEFPRQGIADWSSRKTESN